MAGNFNLVALHARITGSKNHILASKRVPKGFGLGFWVISNGEIGPKSSGKRFFFEEPKLGFYVLKRNLGTAFCV